MISLTSEDKRTLLSVARSAIENHVKGGDHKEDFTLTPALQEHCGAFVTIKNSEMLRGCIGLITSDRPLHETVSEMAVSAATRDMRFEQVTVEELPEIDLEISVLSPFETITDIAEIEVGTHGLFIKQSHFQGLLLPQVATENNWDRNTFLEYTCLKAGLPASSWKDENTVIQIFSAEVFGERE